MSPRSRSQDPDPALCPTDLIRGAHACCLPGGQCKSHREHLTGSWEPQEWSRFDPKFPDGEGRLILWGGPGLCKPARTTGGLCGTQTGPWSTRGRKQDKCVDAEIRLQGQYALHLPSHSRPWALASSRGWLEALRPPAETTLGSEGIWVRKWEVVFKAPGKRLKATCRWAGLRNPL